MLYQIRDSKSKQLDEQVMGRVRRNPRLLDFETLSTKAQELASTAWIWGIIPKDENAIRQVSLFDDFNIQQKIKITPTSLNVSKVNESFDLDSYLQTLNATKENLAPKSIFTLYRELNKQDNTIINQCYTYADTYAKWQNYTQNLNHIAKKHSEYMVDYEKTMITLSDVSFPYESSYVENDDTITLDDWIWHKKDNNTDFSFDSLAEKKWAEVLKDIRHNFIEETKENLLGNKFLWGKNFPNNSEIKFQYYLDGVHSSYPDFVLKDKNGKIHIFEVKSVNVKNNSQIDTEEYEEKVRALKDCYKECSKKTGHIFYLPIMQGSDWKIYCFINGEEKQMGKQQFLESF